MAMTDVQQGVATHAELDRTFKALADPTRRSLLALLGQKEHFCTLDGESLNGVCVQDLSGLLDLPQSTVSRHLAVLRQAGLVGQQQKGIWHYYFCHAERVLEAQRWLAAVVTGATGATSGHMASAAQAGDEAGGQAGGEAECSGSGR